MEVVENDGVPFEVVPVAFASQTVLEVLMGQQAVHVRDLDGDARVVVAQVDAFGHEQVLPEHDASVVERRANLHTFAVDEEGGEEGGMSACVWCGRDVGMGFDGDDASQCAHEDGAVRKACGGVRVEADAPHSVGLLVGCAAVAGPGGCDAADAVFRGCPDGVVVVLGKGKDGVV